MEIREHLAGLGLDAQTQDALAALPLVEAPAHACLFSAGSECSGLPILLEGEVQVWLSHSSGRELLWYDLHPGEPCLASTSAILGQEAHRATARAVTPVKLMLVPMAQVQRLVSESGPFREYVLKGYVQRWHSALDRLYTLAFQGIDQQLADLLLHHPQSLLNSHQEIADQMGTAREVITRALHRLEDLGAIRLGRRRIEILDPAPLRALINPFGA